jgi:UDPglucose 6-dehydrogenase
VLNQIKSAVMLLSEGALVLVSSQLPVGSIAILENFAKERMPNKNISFASSPENLRLGKALNVFLHPDRIIVGTRSNEDRIALETLLCY